MSENAAAAYSIVMGMQAREAAEDLAVARGIARINAEQRGKNKKKNQELKAEVAAVAAESAAWEEYSKSLERRLAELKGRAEANRALGTHVLAEAVGDEPVSLSRRDANLLRQRFIENISRQEIAAAVKTLDMPGKTPDAREMQVITKIRVNPLPQDMTQQPKKSNPFALD